MAFFVVVFREPVLRLLLCRGNFTESDLQEAAQATLFLGMGLPFFCSLKAILPVFYAWKQVNKVLKVSILCILANIVMNLILMWPLKQGGIALATVLSSILNNTLLLILLAKAGLDLPVSSWVRSFLRAVLAASIAGGDTCPARVVMPDGEVAAETYYQQTYAAATVDLSDLPVNIPWLSVSSGAGESRSFYIHERHPELYRSISDKR